MDWIVVSHYLQSRKRMWTVSGEHAGGDAREHGKVNG